ncbi:MAG: cyclic nucleotide-binding domain-containing protein [Acidimicrobiia bacterium]|nr:cyclic nucleotide-binding domain-containing protein [Acidimicrobiia bacterium]
MSRRSQIVSGLEQVPLFASCSKRERGIIARHMEVVTVAEGTEVMAEGEAGDAFYTVLEGSVQLARGGRRIGTLGEGESFGELALLDPGPRNATVVATAPTSLGVLGARVFSVLLKELPNMSDKLLRAMAKRLREADAKTVQ